MWHPQQSTLYQMRQICTILRVRLLYSGSAMCDTRTPCRSSISITQTAYLWCGWYQCLVFLISVTELLPHSSPGEDMAEWSPGYVVLFLLISMARCSPNFEFVATTTTASSEIKAEERATQSNKMVLVRLQQTQDSNEGTEIHSRTSRLNHGRLPYSWNKIDMFNHMLRPRKLNDQCLDFLESQRLSIEAFSLKDKYVWDVRRRKV